MSVLPGPHLPRLPDDHGGYRIGPLGVGDVEGLDPEGWLLQTQGFAESLRFLNPLRSAATERLLKSQASVFRHRRQKGKLRTTLG